MALNFLVFVFLGLAFGREYVGSLQIRHEIRELESLEAQLGEEQLQTLSLIRDLSSEYYLETEARTKHGLGRAGETLLVIEEGGAADAVVLGVTDESLTFVSNEKRWFYFFFHKERWNELRAL